MIINDSVKRDRDLVKNGLKTIAGVALTAGALGYIVGKHKGYRRGITVGQIKTYKELTKSIQKLGSQTKHSL